MNLEADVTDGDRDSIPSKVVEIIKGFIWVVAIVSFNHGDGVARVGERTKIGNNTVVIVGTGLAIGRANWSTVDFSFVAFDFGDDFSTGWSER